MAAPDDRKPRLILVRNDSGEPQLCCAWEIESDGLAYRWHVVPTHAGPARRPALERWLPV